MIGINERHIPSVPAFEHIIQVRNFWIIDIKNENPVLMRRNGKHIL